MSELSIPERVAAGAAWLDENRPGWWERIDIPTLDLGHCQLCVLGQEYGDYDDAPDAAKYNDAYDWNGEYDQYRAPAMDRGFERYSRSREEYVELTTEWRRLIESRRAAVKA